MFFAPFRSVQLPPLSQSADNCLIEPDRVEAIKLGYNLANVGDIVLVLGKGAENYMDFKGTKIPYNDMNIIKNLGRYV